MSIYDISGNPLTTLYGINGNVLDIAYDVNGNIIYGNTNDGIKRTLKNVTNFPDSFGLIVGKEYVETFIANDGYTLENATVSVKKDGVDITDSVYTMGAVVIDAASEDIEISIEAVKINYVIPPASDFTLQVYNGMQAIKSYDGTETCIEIPSEIDVDGVVYQTCLYNTTIPTTVEHLKLSCATPAYGTLQGMLASAKIDNVKTFWNNTDEALYFKTGANAERILTPNQKDSTTFYGMSGNAKVTTARQMEYPTSVTAPATIFYGDSRLVDAGIIPSWITSLHMAFMGCTSLERIVIDAKNVNNHGNWIAGGVPATCKVRLHEDSATFAYLRGEAVKGTGSGLIEPVLHLHPYDDTEIIHTIICMGDSLTRGIGCDDAPTEAYPVKLLEKLSNNTIVYNEGQGSTTVDNHRTRLLSPENKQYLSEALVILWTGTNGNGSGDNTVETLQSLIQEMISEMGNNTKFLLIPAVAAALGTGETETHIAHKQWCIDGYGADHVFDVYEWFREKGYERENYMVDSLHYNAEGYDIVAQGIYEKLNANGWVTPA